MAILTTDIKFFLSGGAGNSDVDASLGGVISTTQLTTASLHNLFDVVSGAEALAGDTEYRCIYVKNDHGSLTLQTAVTWIATNTPSTDSVIAIGLGSSAISGTEQTVANESTAPSAVTLSAPASLGAGLAIGNLGVGATKAIWIRRIISATASAFTTDTATISVGGDTAA